MGGPIRAALFLGVSYYDQPAGYNATLDPRTGRPVLPIDADNIQKADAESLPLTDEDNQGIDIGDDDMR